MTEKKTENGISQDKYDKLQAKLDAAIEKNSELTGQMKGMASSEELTELKDQIKTLKDAAVDPADPKSIEARVEERFKEYKTETDRKIEEKDKALVALKTENSQRQVREEFNSQFGDKYLEKSKKFHHRRLDENATVDENGKTIFLDKEGKQRINKEGNPYTLSDFHEENTVEHDYTLKPQGKGGTIGENSSTGDTPGGKGDTKSTHEFDVKEARFNEQYCSDCLDQFGDDKAGADAFMDEVLSYRSAI